MLVPKSDYVPRADALHFAAANNRSLIGEDYDMANRIFAVGDEIAPPWKEI